jgi:hypothetical protein
MLLLLIFAGMLQVAYLYMGQIIAHHASFVTARSYIVGFDRRIVQRAREVGSIGFSGHIVDPPAYEGMTPAELGAVEPQLIEQFVQYHGYLMHYEHWPHVSDRTPTFEVDGVVTIGVHVNDYPLQMPMRRAYTRDDSIDFQSETRLYNHAAYYLE